MNNSMTVRFSPKDLANAEHILVLTNWGSIPHKHAEFAY